MKLKNTTFLMLVLVVTPIVVFAQTGPVQEVQTLERAWLDAYEQHDQKAMDRIVADDFLITFSNGSTQTKAQVMSSIKPTDQTKRPSTKFYTEGVQARVYGDTVILTGRVIAEWQRDGQPPAREASRYTDTYVKRNGRWQVVASHLSNDASAKKSN